MVALGLATRAEAQGTPPRTLRDSALALLADSLLDEALAPPPALRTLTVRGVTRRYQVAGTTVTELAAPVQFLHVGDRVGVRLSGTPLGFSAPLGSLSGTTPVRGRLSLRIGARDTVQLYGQTASTPGALDAAATAALGSVATSTLDLDAIGMGVPAGAGVRGVLTRAVGGVAVGVEALAELQPRPGGTTPVFWRGRTVGAGLSVAGFAGDARIAVGADWSQSTADSLGGRNLFPGGGLVTLDATLDGPLGGVTSTTYGTLAAFWARPYQNARADQPNRLIPQGSFWGVQGDLSVDVGRVTLTPTASLLRESSTVDIGTSLLPARLTSSGWTFTAGSGLELRLGRGVSLVPEAGVAWGSVGTRTSAAVRTRRGRTLIVPRATDDPIRGVWAGLGVRATW